jgi:hypothetical protein
VKDVKLDREQRLRAEQLVDACLCDEGALRAAVYELIERRDVLQEMMETIHEDAWSADLCDRIDALQGQDATP